MFDRTKPFYPLVVHYVVLLWAVKELSIRGIIDIGRDLGISDEKLAEIGAEASRAVAAPFNEALAPLSLASAITTLGLDIDIADFAKELPGRLRCRL